MKLFRISLVRKLLILLFLVSGVSAAVLYYFSGSKALVVTTDYFVYFALSLLLIFALFSYLVFVKPLDVILEQMEALVAGKPYKKIYTNRIDEIGVLAHFFNQVTKGFSEVSSDIKDRERMIDELAIASSLQRDILPLSSPKISGLQVIAKNKPASEVGGDIFNFITSKDKTYIFIGDVTGHGVAAALIMTMATSLISVFADSCSSAYEILVSVNRYIKRHIKRAMYMTMVMLSWDVKAQKLTYVGAGHEHILVYHVDTGVCDAILSGGIALGMVPDNSKLIKEQEISWNDGDFVVVYSDGITEARNAAGELYGLERLKNALIEFAPQYSAEGVNYHIAQDVSTFAKGHVQDDDMSLIVIKRDKSLTQGADVADQSITWSA
ncbi:MAG: PP2C family protein-serine/threonine phosphatase [Candidatus Peregrinibacteria bacterium]|nr:PP2C family protein-serine/threonine phosphatase [Candidatus Peregrinibacteria bacterium]